MHRVARDDEGCLGAVGPSKLDACPRVVAGLVVDPPAVAQGVAVGVIGACDRELHLIARLRLHLDNTAAVVAVADGEGRVVGLAPRLDAPVHAGLEVILEVGPPPPHGRAGVGLPVHGVLRVHEDAEIGVTEAPAPATPVGMGRIAQAVGQEVEPRGRIALLERRVGVRRSPGLRRIERAERAVALADVGVDPLARGQALVAAEVHAAEDRLALVLAPGRPREDVEEPGDEEAMRDAVLVGDVVDPQLRDARAEAHVAAVAAHAPQGLREIGLAAPDADVHRPRVRLVCDLDDPAGALGVVAFAHVLPAAQAVAALDRREQVLGGGIAVGVLPQAGKHLAVCLDGLADEVGAGRGLLQLARRAGGGGDEALDVELIGVEHQADHRLLVVGVAADVGEHDEPRTLAGRRRRGACHGSHREGQQGKQQAGEIAGVHGRVSCTVTMLAARAAGLSPGCKRLHDPERRAVTVRGRAAPSAPRAGRRRGCRRSGTA